MRRHVNIPVFIPHLGCPNMCVFCNQRTISGVNAFDISSVKNIIDEHLRYIDSDTDVEIAFFGGSFTGIDRDLMVSLLEIAYSYVLDNKVQSIRCSTRPDYISDEILEVLKNYGVKTVELGLQSVSDRVLMITKRGHSFIDEERACKLVVDHGFELVGQMMIGLPGASIESELQTADFIISSGATAARIYPTVVFKDTELCNMAMRGEYDPLSLESAIDRSSAVLGRFLDNGVEVIRIGLCASDNLLSDETYYAGPNHPALGELVENELYYKRILEKLSGIDISEGMNINIFVSPGALSKAVGQKRKNKLRLLNYFSFKSVNFFERDDVLMYDAFIQIENGDKKCI